MKVDVTGWSPVSNLSQTLYLLFSHCNTPSEGVREQRPSVPPTAQAPLRLVALGLQIFPLPSAMAPPQSGPAPRPGSARARASGRGAGGEGSLATSRGEARAPAPALAPSAHQVGPAQP